MDPKFYMNLVNTPLSYFQNAIKGGVMIATAASLYYILFGGMLGMSGLIGSIVKYATQSTTRPKIIIILGLIMSSAVALILYRQKVIPATPFDSKEYIESSSLMRLIVAGFLVGCGVQLQNGCTSGHGLCGLPRFSIRSYVSVLIFLSTAFVVATSQAYKYLPDVPRWLKFDLPSNVNPEIFLGGAAVLALLFILSTSLKKIIQNIILLLIGFLFGAGLMTAGMSKRSKIQGFVTLNSKWDPSLLFVLMTGVLLNIIPFTLMRLKAKTSIFGQKVEDMHGKVTLRLIIGAIVFGAGWGIGGFCPGPFVLSIPNSLKIALYWGVPYIIAVKLISVLFPQSRQIQVPSQIKKD